MKKLVVSLRRAPDDVLMVGTLAERDHRVYFEYEPSFLESGLELSPYKLPAMPGLIDHADHAFGPLPGLFDDSLPDGWGLLLMDRAFRRQGIEPATLSPLDRLAYLGTRTMGALTYHPPAVEQSHKSDQLLDLYALGHNAQEVMQGDAAEILPELQRAGGSPGGARPKVLVGVRGGELLSGEDDLPDGFEHWLIKFPAREDEASAGPIEYAYSRMAQAAGIEMPPTRLFEAKQGRKRRCYFGVQRFDRAANNRRFHVHTFANLIHANFRIPSTDYADLFKVTAALTLDHSDLLQLFRRMVFNIAAHNRDDHAKNFAFILDDVNKEWRLAPAYDLTFAHGPGGEHTTSVQGEGRSPGRAECLQQADQFGLKRRMAEDAIEQINAAVEEWPAFAGEAGSPQRDVRRVGRAMRVI